ncbi:MAG: hypothetical protein ACPGJS_05920 [Flammeovirgaceae bacterium]
MKETLLKQHVHLSFFNKRDKDQRYFDSFSAENCLIVSDRMYAHIQQDFEYYWPLVLKTIDELYQLLPSSKTALGLQVMLDANTIFNVKLDRSLGDARFQQSFQKMIAFLQQQKPVRGYGNPFFVYFDTHSSEWKKVEVLDLFEEEIVEPKPQKQHWKAKKKGKKR